MTASMTVADWFKTSDNRNFAGFAAGSLPETADHPRDLLGKEVFLDDRSYVVLDVEHWAIECPRDGERCTHQFALHVRASHEPTSREGILQLLRASARRVPAPLTCEVFDDGGQWWKVKLDNGRGHSLTTTHKESGWAQQYIDGAANALEVAVCDAESVYGDGRGPQLMDPSDHGTRDPR